MIHTAKIGVGLSFSTTPREKVFNNIKTYPFPSGYSEHLSINFA
jgi:hypothetical protein